MIRAYGAVTPLRRRVPRAACRVLRHYYREDGPGLVSEEDGWVSPGYFVVTNAVARALCRPSDYVLRRFRPA